jgi:succinyl-CoA synthetase beta subunit
VRIYEHEAKTVFAGEGLAVPRCHGTVHGLEDFARLDIEYPVMIKAQVLVGGRGKAGGIKKARNPDEARDAISHILGMKIGDYVVESVLIEGAAEYRGACYVGVTVNPATANSVLMASASGGVDIEEIARTRPEAILKIELPENPETLPDEVTARFGAFLARDLGEDDAMARALGLAVKALYDLYQRYDCKVAEINPLLVTAEGPLAVDGKMVLDDNAIYRQQKLLSRLGILSKRHDVSEPTSREQRAEKGGFTYVDLLPEDAAREPGRIYVGLVPGGAGYGIFSIDEVSNVGDRYFEGKVVPLNFMDSGGGPSRKGVAEMFSLLMDHPLVDLIVTSRFGGISSCDTFIRGLCDCLRERARTGRRVVPVHGRMVGTDLAAARAFLEVAYRETPEALASLEMVVGNQKIMFDVIHDGIQKYVQKQAEKQAEKKAENAEVRS